MGFKLYNGCPNDELQAHWDSQDRAKEYIRSRGLLITWFPVEQKYAMCYKDTYQAIGDWFSSPEAAAAWVKKTLVKCRSPKCNNLVDSSIQAFCDKHGGVI